MYKQYDFFGFCRLIRSFILTKLFYSNARLIRFPFDIRNKKFIKIGNNLTCGYNCRFEAYPFSNKSKAVLLFGENVEINDNVHISAGECINIGNNVLIASKIFITDINHGSYKGLIQDEPTSIPKNRKLSTSPVTIEDNVWIGEGSCILPGVTIGEGSIIGTLSVVTKDIPKNSIAIGNPARVIKRYDFEFKIWINV